MRWPTCMCAKSGHIWAEANYGKRPALAARSGQCSLPWSVRRHIEERWTNLQVSPCGHPAGALLSRWHTPVLLLPLTAWKGSGSVCDTTKRLPVCGSKWSQSCYVWDWPLEHEIKFHESWVSCAVDPTAHSCRLAFQSNWCIAIPPTSSMWDSTGATNSCLLHDIMAT